jgi:molybdenum cofactor cytidylyltransferase
MGSSLVAGVVLAAGASIRMGQSKILLEIEGESLVRRSVRRAIGAGLSPVIVVLGHEAARAHRELRGLACDVVVNPDYAKGMSTSLGAGIAAVPETAEAAMVILADMPFVTSEMMAEVILRHRESGAPLVASRYGDVTAPPTLYDRALFAELKGGEGEGRGREVVRRHAEQAVYVCWDAAALCDIDTPEDYREARAARE